MGNKNHVLLLYFQGLKGEKEGHYLLIILVVADPMLLVVRFLCHKHGLPLPKLVVIWTVRLEQLSQPPRPVFNLQKKYL